MYRFVLFVSALVASANGASFGGRIVGGTNAAEGAYPHQVSLQNNDRHFCGGSIINEQWILTAGHCISTSNQVNPSRLQIVAGTNKLSEGGDVYLAIRVIVHPDYNWLWIRNDIALIQTSGNIVFGPKVQPIPMPTEDFTKENYPGVLAGWGNDGYPNGVAHDDLQEVDVIIIDQPTCLARSIRTTDSNICTSTAEAKGACHGDSGGPLVADGVQVGIVSWGTPCAVGEPDVYTRVWKFMEWIDEHVKLI